MQNGGVHGYWGLGRNREMDQVSPRVGSQVGMNRLWSL